MNARHNRMPLRPFRRRPQIPSVGARTSPDIHHDAFARHLAVAPHSTVERQGHLAGTIGRRTRRRTPVVVVRLHRGAGACRASSGTHRSEEHTSELQSLMRNSYAVFCLKKKKTHTTHTK